MPAHQHCDLFYPLVGDLIGSTINWVMLWSSGPGQVLGSYVANRVLAVRLVVGLQNTRKKERKKESSLPGLKTELNSHKTVPPHICTHAQHTENQSAYPIPGPHSVPLPREQTRTY